MTKVFIYRALRARQSPTHNVFVFAAPAKDVMRFAAVDRIGRTGDGKLKGFQRPQVASHIREIREYLSREDAVLPNSVVVAFTKGAEFEEEDGGAIRIQVDDSPAGLIVDGQQRLTALSQLPEKDFEVFVTGLICESQEELRRQFILINSTKPLPKTLIYELLPTVDGLPERMSARSTAAHLVAMLNYETTSSLRGQIKQHTNPTGVIQDTAMQKVIMSSLSDGVLRNLIRDGLDSCFQLISEFFWAVQSVFPDAWEGHKPRTSRLVHGAGIIGMGYVMEHLYATQGCTTRECFAEGLKPLKGRTAWTEGVWRFGDDNIRPWNSLQFVPRDYMELSQYLVRVVRNGQREKAGL